MKVLHLAQNSLVIFTLCEVAGHNGEIDGLQGEHTAGQLLLFFTSCQDQLRKVEMNPKAQREYEIFDLHTVSKTHLKFNSYLKNN